jgi:hypothetical protein
VPPAPDPWESDITPPPVPATPYQLLHELAVVQARIEAKLDGVVGATADHEQRLRALEATGAVEHGRAIDALTAQVASLQRWRWLLTGAAAAAGTGGGALTTALLQR